MSAIFGLVAVHGDGLPGPALEAMRSALAGHGGDGGDTWALGGAGLGQQLKLVTPEDRFERQPLVSQDGLRVLVSDGRIDNRPELSARAGAHVAAQTGPDSAFILAAYERWGTDCGQHLIGSFCFAIWDAGRRRLLLARSPFGAKPVFFHQAADFVAFATMPRALFALPGVPRRLCLESIADNLILVPLEPGASLFHDIRSLEPGHALTVGPPRLPGAGVLETGAAARASTALRRGVRGGVHGALRPGRRGSPAEPEPGRRADERRPGFDIGGGHGGSAARPAR